MRGTSLWKLGLLPVAVALGGLAMVIFSLATPTRAVEAVPATPAPLTDWVIAVGTTGTVSVIDASTDIVYGPVLSGVLGTAGGGLFDVAVVPGTNLALISNFGDQTVFFVDFSQPLSPSVVTSVTLGFYAEDIAVTRDGQVAYVTDGGFSPLVAAIDIVSRSAAYTANLGTHYANAVAWAPDGTVIVADYFPGALHALYPDASGILTVTGTYTYALTPDGQVVLADDTGGSARVSAGEPRSAAGAVGTDADAFRPLDQNAVTADAMNARPVNVAVAPDGQTVIMANVGAYDPPTNTLYTVGIYRITAPGVLSFTGAITNLTRSTQSIAFSAAGDKAYLSQNQGKVALTETDHLSVLEIVEPGVVRLALDGAAVYSRVTGSQLFGVDTIAVVRNKAYLGYPTVSGGDTDLRVVDLSDYSVTELTMPGIIVGVDVLSPKRVLLPLVVSGGQPAR